MNKSEFTTVGKSVFEFRYDPILSFCDWKGSLAEHLIEKLGFEGFRIANSRIDLTNPESQDFLVFVGMQNAGLLIEDNIDIKKLQEKIDKFITALNSFDKFKPKNIGRIGVRLSFLRHKRNVSFAQIKTTFENYIIKLNESPYKDFEGVVRIDVGLPLSFKSKNYDFKITHGPMERKQALLQFFTNKSVYEDDSNAFPKSGLFFDIDVSKIGSEAIDLDEIKKRANEFALVGNEKFEYISNELFSHIQ
ncbi:MAG: hypothetical protein WCX23_01765 [Candidatus Paceibacterota bacterium]|jgi:hypothetical protein